jgi:hypothetical protein
MLLKNKTFFKKEFALFWVGRDGYKRASRREKGDQ